MNKNFGFYVNRKNIPLSFYPLIILAVILFGALAVLGLFVGAVVGAIGIGYVVLRSLFSSKTKGATKRVDDDGKTIILRADEYKIIEKKK